MDSGLLLYPQNRLWLSAWHSGYLIYDSRNDWSSLLETGVVRSAVAAGERRASAGEKGEGMITQVWLFSLLAWISPGLNQDSNRASAGRGAVTSRESGAASGSLAAIVFSSANTCALDRPLHGLGTSSRLSHFLLG